MNIHRTLFLRPTEGGYCFTQNAQYNTTYSQRDNYASYFQYQKKLTQSYNISS